MTDSTPPVTPARFRELAAAAEALASEIDAARLQARAAGDEPTRHATFRTEDAASLARQVGHELEATAEDLARVRGRSNCGVSWGACPEHGATLHSSGGQCWCETPGCGRRWGYDRLGAPCSEPAAFAAQDQEGTKFLICAGHAIDARARLVGATFRAL